MLLLLLLVMMLFLDFIFLQTRVLWFRQSPCLMCQPATGVYESAELSVSACEGYRSYAQNFKKKFFKLFCVDFNLEIVLIRLQELMENIISQRVYWDQDYAGLCCAAFDEFTPPKSFILRSWSEVDFVGKVYRLIFDDRIIFRSHAVSSTLKRPQFNRESPFFNQAQPSCHSLRVDKLLLASAES